MSAAVLNCCQWTQKGEIVLKKKRISGIFLFALIFLAAGGIGMTRLKPDWVYVVCDEVLRIGRSASVGKLDSSTVMEEYTLEQLLERKDCRADQSLMLINTEFPVTEQFDPEIDRYKDTDVVMNICMMDAYERMSAYIADRFQEDLYIRSAYRTAEEQETAIAEQGEKATAVNASEHQAGLSLDVYIKYFAGSSFLKTKVGQFVNSSCWEYGFIIRYPYYGTKQTGIGFEPWHIRYVGCPHAEIIYKNSLTLEEYLDRIEQDQFYVYGKYVITKQKGDVFHLPEGFSSLVISPDNRGNYVITMKMP